MKTLKRGLTGILMAAGLVLAAGSPAAALPTLQLDIAGGFYDPVTETILTDQDSFTLYAYLSFDGTNGSGGPTGKSMSDLIGTTYYLWTALTPKVDTSATLGSFDLNGTTVNATADMTYGTPPIEPDHGNPDQDLPKHGIYDTYYLQTAFTFTDDLAHRADPYNTADATGSTPSYSGGDYMLFEAFSVDRTLLSDLYELHFDLGSTVLVSNPKHGDDLQVDIFAPFSHDAGTGTGHQVPEPSTVMLLGAGLLALALIGWRRERQRD
jgi:PEP-CTERM motif